MKTLIAPPRLGDNILNSGAAVELARIHGELRVPTYTRYMESVKSFYVNHPEIEVYAVDEPAGCTLGYPPIECFQVIGEPIACGIYGPKIESSDVSWPEAVYRQLGIDYAHRWDSCPIQDAWQKTGPQVLQTPRYFVHDDPERGYLITKLIPLAPQACFRPTMGPFSILRYAFALAQASEVHVIDSAFLHLAESLDTFGRLFLHLYARGLAPDVPGGIRTIRHDYPTRKKWEIIS